MRIRLLLLCPLLFFLAGCWQGRPTKPSEAAGAPREEERPTMILRGADYVVKNASFGTIRLHAEEIATDDKASRATIRNAAFRQEGENGVEGEAGLIVVDMESSDAVLSGGVSIALPSEGFSVSADAISWDNGERLLTTDKDAVVSVVFDGTNTVTGIGFSADISRGTYEFQRLEGGSIVQ